MLKEFHSRKERSILEADSRDDNGGAIGHDLGFPKTTANFSVKIFALLGGDRWVDPSCLDYLQEAKLQIFLGAS